MRGEEAPTVLMEKLWGVYHDKFSVDTITWHEKTASERDAVFAPKLLPRDRHFCSAEAVLTMAATRD